MKKGSSEGLRPTLPDDADPAYVSLLQSVWNEDPLQRPTFSHLLKQLEALSPQRGDLMDNLVSMVIGGGVVKLPLILFSLMPLLNCFVVAVMLFLTF